MSTTDAPSIVRTMPIGAELQAGGGVHVRVWAPKPKHLRLWLDGRDYDMQDDGAGYRVAFVDRAKAGSRYGFLIGGTDRIVPDPTSRSQPDGVHGTSAVVDPHAYTWHDESWRGPTGRHRVIYEMHVGTFTSAGTWRAAIERLPLLVDVGVTIIEMMPVAEFPGCFGWGYDGVGLFAPTRLYGEPDDLRAFVDAAHALGLSVIHDVVYNHFGPDGNYLSLFSDSYLTDRYDNEWGQAVDFDGPDAAGTREFVRENAAYWIREFHFDGLRLDATQQIFDASPRHVVSEIGDAARAAGRGRSIYVIAENEPQHAQLVRPEPDGFGLDAIWNEDFHHTARVTLTGFREGYYNDYSGSAKELRDCIEYGFLYQGQRSAWQKESRGAPALDLTFDQRVNFLENHDQVANSRRGARLPDLTSPGRMRAMTALLLTMPGTPLLFQGQEFASSAPFVFFANHEAELAAAVWKGRRGFLAQFPSVLDTDVDDPNAPETFFACRLDWSERDANAWALQLHRDLITLRRDDPVICAPARVAASALSEHVVIVRWRSDAGDRLGLFNFASDFEPSIIPDPLLAPPAECRWEPIWNSEDIVYGGAGVFDPFTEDGRLLLRGPAAVLLTAR